MPTDLNEVRNALVDVARDIVGTQLSQIPGPNNTTKAAVLKVRKDISETEFPYIVLELGARRRQGLDVLRQQLDPDDFTEYETHYDYFFSYTVRGGDAMKIAGDLEAGFREYEHLNTLLESDITLVDTQDVIPSYEEIGGQFLELATFNIIVTVPDVNARDEGCFSEMEISGSALTDVEDTDPINFNFRV